MNLQFSLVGKWFYMTKERVKTEDYREITPYWVKRFYNVKNIKNGSIDDLVSYFKEPSYYKESESVFLKKMNVKKKVFTTNIMTLGYPKSTDTERILKLEHKGIEVRGGKLEWGAEPNKIYFVVLHGNLLTK